MTDLISNLNWRYATKLYDTSKKVSAENLSTLKEAIRLSVSSSGLQPYKVFLIEDESVRQKLREVGYNQPQITDASNLFVFANIINVSAEDVDKYIAQIAKTRSVTVESLQGFSESMKNNISGMNDAEKNSWTAKQTYIALGNLINAAAHLRLDATPMEGFQNDKFDEILGLKEMGLHAAVIAAVGYRHPDDKTQHYVKVRKPNDELFVTI